MTWIGKEAENLRREVTILLLALAAAGLTGCGTTQSNLATQQLLMSDAVDRAVARVDFQPLSGKKVFFDDRFIQNVKGLGFVNSEYFVSALRQQMLAAGCEVQEKLPDADFVVEARVGALGTDSHDLTYGLPASKALSSGLSALPNVPDIPAIPEISVARRNDQVGAAKVAVYAYHRESRTPVWQSGTSVALSDARNAWLFGVGPIQTGTIYKNGPRFAGDRLRLPWQKRLEPPMPSGVIPLNEAYTFHQGPEPMSQPPAAAVQTVGHEAPTAPAGTAAPAPTNSSPPAEPAPPAAQPTSTPIPSATP